MIAIKSKFIINIRVWLIKNKIISATNNIDKQKLLVFTDGSVNTTSKVGYGAYLVIAENELLLENKSKVKLIRFEDTSSTKLELQTLVFALQEIKTNDTIIVYTDSQNIIGLMGRRERLEKNNYYSKNKILLKNQELYKAFFRITDRLDCEFVKVSGHKSSKQKDDIDKIFTLVDRASRDAQRNK